MNFFFDTRKLDKCLRNVALDISKQIRDNCAKQLDMHDAQMDAYSEAYVIAKAAYQSKSKSKKRHNLNRASVVNMRRTGLMLRSISITKRSNTSYEIYIADQSRAIIAYYHHTGKGQPKREFFGVSKANETRIYNKNFNTELLSK